MLLLASGAARVKVYYFLAPIMSDATLFFEGRRNIPDFSCGSRIDVNFHQPD
jgi:hypothetical protein